MCASNSAALRSQLLQLQAVTRVKSAIRSVGSFFGLGLNVKGLGRFRVRVKVKGLGLGL